MPVIDFNQWGCQDESDEIDFEHIKAQAAGSMEMILHRWLPGGRLNGREYICAGVGGGKGESCSTNIQSGVGSDFAAGVTWGDVIELVAKVDGLPMGEAAKRLQEFLGNAPVVPTIPKQTEAEKLEHSRKMSLSLWIEGEECPPTHAYLLSKQVNADPGIRYHPKTGDLLIPLRSGQDLLGVQRIGADGSKKVNPGGKMSGCYHIIAGEHDTVYLCEGYATAMTVHMVTGKTTVVAVSAGNLAPVGEKVAKLYPGAHLVIAADNDQDKDPNPGVKAANDAVKKIGRGTVVAPPFPSGQKGDWNDYAVEHGARAARELLLVQAQRSLPTLIDLIDFQPKPPEYLIDRLIETPCTGMLVGASGSGKTFVALDFALCVATGKSWHGRTVRQGPVIYICGEGKYGIPRRTGAWFHRHGMAMQRGQFHLTTQRVEINQVAATKLMADIDEIAKRHGVPALIIFDTLARSLPADADENSANDMQSWINCVDTIRDRYNCVALIVHHTGHADEAKGRARGSSALKGAMDLEILVNKGKGIIECTKGKDMEPWSPIRYELKSVQVGDWSSAVAEFDFDYDPRKDRRTAYRSDALAALDEAISRERLGDRCTKDAWGECFEERFQDEPKKTIWRRLWDKEKGEAWRMIEDGQVEKQGRFFVRVMTQTEITESIFKNYI